MRLPRERIRDPWELPEEEPNQSRCLPRGTSLHR